jgi:hypothetical protein
LITVSQVAIGMHIDTVRATMANLEDPVELLNESDVRDDLSSIMYGRSQPDFYADILYRKTTGEVIMCSGQE